MIFLKEKFLIKMEKVLINRFDLVNIGYVCYNGIYFDLFYLDAILFSKNIDGSLFGVNISENFFYIDLFFITIKIFDKIEL